MSTVIEFPSGLQLQIRGLKGKEGKLLGDQRAIRQGTVFDTMLSACTECVIDPGPYDVQAGATKFDWDKALIGDRYFMFLQIRLLSFGPKYIFKAQCREPFCRERFDYEIDLETDLEILRFSDEDRELFRRGEPFVTRLKDGTEVRYRLPTGRDEKKAAKNRNGEAALTSMLADRIQSIEGVGEINESNIGGRGVVRGVKEYLEDLEWSELTGLMNALDDHNCGVKTEIEIECAICGGRQDTVLPFDRAFLMPKEDQRMRA